MRRDALLSPADNSMMVRDDPRKKTDFGRRRPLARPRRVRGRAPVDLEKFEESPRTEA